MQPGYFFLSLVTRQEDLERDRSLRVTFSRNAEVIVNYGSYIFTPRDIYNNIYTQVYNNTRNIHLIPMPGR